MASYHNSLHTKHRFESPAKVFAKLKSKVQREKHGADLNSAGKRTESSDDLNESSFVCYREEVKAVTLSPILSPQQPIGHSFLDTGNWRGDRMSPAPEIGCAARSRRGHALTNRTYLESTAMSVVNQEHVLSEPAPIRHSDGCKTNRTPVKIPTVQNDGVRGVFEVETAPKNHQMPPAKFYSPMKNWLRKRKCDQDVTKMSSSINEISAKVVKHQRIPSVLSNDSTHNNTAVEALHDVGGFSTDRSEMNQFTDKLMFPTPRSKTKKECFVVMEKLPMSPAKMFTYMKERESKWKQQDVHEVTSSTRELFREGDFFQSQDIPLSTTYNKCETGNRNFWSVPEAVAPIKPVRVDTPDTESHPSSDDVVVPTVESQPVLFEDPLVLNSPHISIPKKRQAVFKHKKFKLPLCEDLPDESIIYLKQWFLRKTGKGLFVDGIHRAKNIPWNSNIIVDRVSDCVVKTVSGRVYVLVGKMKMDMASGFPKWFLKKFVNGFPPNWKELHEKFLSESRDRGTEKNSEGRNNIAKKKSEASSINVSVQRCRQKPLKTPASYPPVFSIKVSRSGRVIKPPLEYWKGGRVLLDAQMNATIHECYNTSICVPEVTKTVSAKKSQKPTGMFLPCSERKGNNCKEEVLAPPRKVRASRRQRNQAKTRPEEGPCNPSEPTVNTVSPEECSHRTRSSQRCPATVRLLHLDTVTQKQRESEKASTCRSKKLSRDTNGPSVSRRKQTVTTSPESVIVNKASQQQSSNDECEIKRKMRTRVTQTNNAAQTLRKCNKMSPPTKPSPKSTQSSKVNKGHTVLPQEQDEDRWTEAELNKLQEAVSCFPKHMTNYWSKVARLVGTRSAADCHHQHTSQGSSQTPVKKGGRPKKVEAPKDTVTDHPVISARAGTLKRKQQVRQFLEAMPKENVDDVFSSAYMQNKRYEMPSICSSDDYDFAMSDLQPLTPMSNIFPDVTTPQCLHISPSMMGSPNSHNDDKYVYQLQRRMKRNQFNVCKQAPTLKSFTPTPSVKQAMRRCGNTVENDNFVVWEMFPGNEGTPSESEEEDFYFSNND